MGVAGTLRYSVLVQQCDFFGAQEAGCQAWMGPGIQSQGVTLVLSCHLLGSISLVLTL